MELLTDREKIIKAFRTRIISDSEEFNTVEIPVGEAVQILELLKEREPKNVIAEKRRVLFDDSGDEPWYCEDTFYHCPSCDLIFSRTHMNKDIHFCSNCGQEMKWNV